jgi:hypothetical protein
MLKWFTLSPALSLREREQNAFVLSPSGRELERGFSSRINTLTLEVYFLG